MDIFYSADRYVYLEFDENIGVHIGTTDIWLQIVSWQIWAQFETKTSETIAVIHVKLMGTFCPQEKHLQMQKTSVQFILSGTNKWDLICDFSSVIDWKKAIMCHVTVL